MYGSPRSSGNKRGVGSGLSNSSSKSIPAGKKRTLLYKKKVKGSITIKMHDPVQLPRFQKNTSDPHDPDKKE